MFSVKDYFVGYPSQLAVANLMLLHGISLKEGNLYVGAIRQSDTQVARAARVDRRVVRSQIDRICAFPELVDLFGNMRSTSDISGQAVAMGCSQIRVVPVDDARPGLLAHIMNILFELGVNIRQALVVREGDGTPTQLVITMDGGIPATAPSRIYEIGGVQRVDILSGRVR